MNISKNLKIVDLSLYLEKEKTLVISDLHLGYEESLNKQGLLIPRFQIKEIKEKLRNILKKVEVKKVILNGDLKHDFGSISFSEWNQILDLIDFFENKEVIIIKGNHDVILNPIVKKRNIKLVDRYDTNNISIAHGDSILKDLKKTIIIGHEHPAISFRDRPGELYKCFLKGKYKNHELIVLPSFNQVYPGSDINKENILSPYIKNIKNFEVFIVEDKVYNFGKLSKINDIN